MSDCAMIIVGALTGAVLSYLFAMLPHTQVLNPALADICRL